MKRSFNENQKLAVEHTKGPALVLAGPGSGKTFVLTNRIFSLIKNEGVAPENILIITFTRAAADEMKERFIKIIKDEGITLREQPTFGTFHSVFFDILKENFGYNKDSVITEYDERRFLCYVLEKENLITVNEDNIKNLIKDIKGYKLAIEKGIRFIPKFTTRNVFFKIYEKYQEKLFNERKLDFHDMVENCYKLLVANKEVLKKYNEKYKYVLIDEFQDINKEQYDLIKLINTTGNIFVVGDDDQSIYKFRGSSPTCMKDFLKDYKNAKKITLNRNYRCAKKIVKFSKLVIDYNKERFDKNLISNRDEVGTMEIKAFIDANEENDYLVHYIKKYQKQGIELKDMAILYRTNLLSSSIITTLKKNNIKYNVKGMDRGLYDYFAIKDVIAYLKLALNDKDSVSLMQVANKPLRYISRDAIGYKNNGIDFLIKYYQNKDFMLKYITKFKYDLKEINKYITPLAIRYIRYNIGYEKYLQNKAKELNIEYEEIKEMLDWFEEEAIGHNDIKEFLSYVEEINDDTNKKNTNVVKDETDNSITLMTFHLSKGLEFKVVFIIDVNDGLIPHKKSIMDDDIETERRLFYVGMTRAKDNLHIYFTKRRFGKNFNASRFILEAVGGQNG